MTKSTRLQPGIAQAKMKRATEIVVPDLRSTASGASSLRLSIRGGLGGMALFWSFGVRAFCCLCYGLRGSPSVVGGSRILGRASCCKGSEPAPPLSRAWGLTCGCRRLKNPRLQVCGGALYLEEFGVWGLEGSATILRVEAPKRPPSRTTFLPNLCFKRVWV